MFTLKTRTILLPAMAGALMVIAAVVEPAAAAPGEPVQAQLDAIARIVERGDATGALHAIREFRAKYGQLACDSSNGGCRAARVACETAGCKPADKVACDTGSCQSPADAKVACDTGSCDPEKARVACEGDNCRSDQRVACNTGSCDAPQRGRVACNSNDCRGEDRVACDSGNCRTEDRVACNGNDCRTEDRVACNGNDCRAEDRVALADGPQLKMRGMAPRAMPASGPTYLEIGAMVRSGHLDRAEAVLEKRIQH